MCRDMEKEAYLTRTTRLTCRIRQIKMRNHNEAPLCWLENAGAPIEPVSESEVFWEMNPTTLYWICSHPNRTFSVVVDCKRYLDTICTQDYPDVQAILSIDGLEVAALVTDVAINETILEFEGIYDGDAAIRPFRFEKLVRWTSLAPGLSSLF